MSEKGAYPYTITITKVNGEANEDAYPSVSGVCNVYNTLPKHRSVVEEYTGTWCGYCPRGFVGLEEMNRLYPDDFIGISYHNGDPMEITSQFPSDVNGFPDCWLDRKGQPVERADCPYELGFVLTQDGMTGTESGWTQSNYYAGEEGWPESMDQFTQGSRSIKGLVFNDVIVARSGIAGIEGSLTAPIVADVAQQYSYAFRMQDVVNTSGQNIVQDKQQLRVIALVIDTRDGSIVNANKAMAGLSSVTTGIARPALTQDETVSHVDYYDLQGRRVVMPRQGSLYIKAETTANGQVRTSKIRM